MREVLPVLVSFITDMKSSTCVAASDKFRGRLPKVGEQLMRTSHALSDPRCGDHEKPRPPLPAPAHPFFQERRAQSRAKHDLLGSYAGAWAGIILAGIDRLHRQGRLPLHYEVHLVYLDAFAGAGRYALDADKQIGVDDPPIWGSPVLALQAIERQAAKYSHFNVSLTGVLVESDPEQHGTFDDLIDSVQNAGLRTLLVLRPDGIIAPGKVNLVHGDFRDVAPQILSSIPERAMLLAFVDPFGPVVSMATMTQIIGRPKTDTIALFPFNDLARKGASSLKSEDNRAAGDRGNITMYDRHFGTEEWQEIYADESLSPDEKERSFVRLYIDQLRHVDIDIVVKEMGLRSSKDPNHTAYYLCMATRDSNGALKFNDLIRQTAARERLEIWRDQEEWLRRREKEWGQGNLLEGLEGEAVPAPQVTPIEAEIEDVKRELQKRCGDNQERPIKDVLKRMSEDVYTEGELMKALRALRKEGLAEFPKKTNVRSQVTVKPPQG